MKSIKDRAVEVAKQYAGKEGFREGGYYWQRKFDGYLQGAIEQAEITKKEMIYKAKSAYCKSCSEAHCPSKSSCENYNDFVKLLEK